MYMPRSGTPRSGMSCYVRIDFLFTYTDSVNTRYVIDRGEVSQVCL